MVFSPLLGYFYQGAQGAGREAEFQATQTFRLYVDLKGAATGDVGVTARISGGGFTAGKLASAAHRRCIELLRK